MNENRNLALDAQGRQTILQEVLKVYSENKLFFVGLAVLIGSVGLLMGAVTTAISVVMMSKFGFELVPAMVVGFTSAGVTFFVLGVAIITHGVKKITNT